MQPLGAVEATKEIRNRSKPICERVKLASEVIDGRRPGFVLPRKETVILEWIFDMLAIDPSAKTSVDLWLFMQQVWAITPKQARLRIFKNHKFVVSLSEVISSTSDAKLIDLVTSSMTQILQEVQLFSTSQDIQARQLVLAYLGNKAATSNSKLGYQIFEAAKSQIRIFGKSEPLVLHQICHEKIREQKRFYLVDYLSTASNSAVPISDYDDLKLLVEAICDVNISVKERLVNLNKRFPNRSSEILETVYAFRRNEVNAELLGEMVEQSFTLPSIDWRFVERCLEINPSPILMNEDHKNKVMSSKIPDLVTVLIIQKVTQLRTLVEFLSAWKPHKMVSNSIFQALCEAVDTLSPSQVVSLVEKTASSNTKILKLIVKSLSYRLASSDPVSNTLISLLLDAGISEDVKKAILDAIPKAPTPKIHKRDDPDLALRAIELNDDLREKLPSVVKRIVDGENIVLRYFPLLEAYADEKNISKLITSVSTEARWRLSNSAKAMECPKVTNCLIESALKAKDLHALSVIPKQAFSWDQRHRVVESAIQSKNNSFHFIGKLILELLDSQNFPSPKSLGQWLGTMQPKASDIEVVVSIVKILKKDAKYIAEAVQALTSEWQKWLVKLHASTNPSELIKNAESWLQDSSKDPRLFDPILSILEVSPVTTQNDYMLKKMTLHYISQKISVPRQLFRLVCTHKYHWALVSAVFIFTTGAEKELAEYCRSLNSDEFKLLVLTAAEESQLTILQALISQRLIDAAIPSFQRAISVAVAKAVSVDGKIDEHFWALCDTILRDSPALLTQFAVDLLLEFAATHKDKEDWNEIALLTSRTLLSKRQGIRSRLHLVISILTNLLENLTATHQAHSFTRLIDNLCNPPHVVTRGRTDRADLTSQVAKERRYVARHADVLLQNVVLIILQNASSYEDWSAVSSALRPALFALVDLIYGNGLKAVSAGMDSASRAYLRNVFEDYKLHSRWVSD